MNVVWSPPARQQRRDIISYIEARNPIAAADMDELFSKAAKRLETQTIGAPGRILGTREYVVHKSYRLVYEVDQAATTASIVTLVHTSRKWPP